METVSVLPRHQLEKVGKLGVIHPDKDDVVVGQRRGNPRTVYVLGTPTTPDQFTVRTREEAVTHALAFARHARVRAWLDTGDDTFRLLGTFREDT